MNMIISHIDKKGRMQSNEEHQRNVSELASEFASCFDMTEWGWVLGLLHDKGKEKQAFQQHILKDSGLRPELHVNGDPSHAYVGALLARENFPMQSPMLINPIMGHHRGLYDSDEMRGILKDFTIPEEVSRTRLATCLPVPPNVLPKDVHHIERMLFSCLVDADFLDTERFMNPRQHRLRGRRATLNSLLDKLEEYLYGLRSKSPDTEVNRIRNYVQDQCRAASGGERGVYSLTVPTGGGKTLASVLWALRHAVRNGQQTIIIAIPYTSIIMQTASVLRSIFGDDCVLEHHSDFEGRGSSRMRTAHRLATENWDYPIIVTTNVQLLESMFANRPAPCRKLHNIVGSVIIMDEAQVLPPQFLQSVLDSLDTYHRLFGVSVLFTTASQPVLTGTIVGSNRLRPLHGLASVKEIIPASVKLHDKLRRVSLEIDQEPTTYDELAERLSRHRRVLCIVNTRADAREIYRRLPKEGSFYHLSRLMYPEHIKATIEKIKKDLEDDSRIIRVVSTQLIEAGVDIDFPVVFRQEAGLDSVLQAAGRCNREGRLAVGKTVVFSFGKPLPPGYMTQANNARRNMAEGLDWLAPDTIREYFCQFYSRVPDFDVPQVSRLLYNPDYMLFETAADIYHLIDDDTVPVIISGRHTAGLLKKLVTDGPTYSLMKKLARYSVNVRQSDLKRMKASGLKLDEPVEGIYTISSDCYRRDIGLEIANNQ